MRHGHFAYQSTPVMVAELAEIGFGATTAWWFPLYGGSVLLAARRGGTQDTDLIDLIAREESVGVLKTDVVRDLQRALGRSWVQPDRKGLSSFADLGWSRLTGGERLR